MIRILAFFLTTLLVLNIAPATVRAQDQDKTQTTAQPTQTAEPPIATIIDVEGSGNIIMRATEQGKVYPAKVNDPLYINDVIQTGSTDGSRMLIVFLDESRFTLGKNAKFTASDYSYDDKDNINNKARYSVLQGAFLYTSGLLTKKPDPDAKISTPYGTIGIRGTSLWGGTMGAEYGVYVDEGQINFTTDRGQMTVNAGQETAVTGINAIPSKPRTAPPEILAAAKKTVLLHNLTQIRSRMAALRERHPSMIRAHRTFMQKMAQRREQQHSLKGDIRRPMQQERMEKQPRRQNKSGNTLQQRLQERRQQREDHRTERRQEHTQDRRQGNIGDKWRQRRSMDQTPRQTRDANPIEERRSMEETPHATFHSHRLRR